MGRSVSTPTKAVEVFYLDWGNDVRQAYEEWEEAGEEYLPDMDGPWFWDDEFDQLIEDLQCNVFGYLFPSVTEADSWIGNEDHVIAENQLAQFGVSEYCGLVAVWVVVNEPRDVYYGDPDTTGLALHWISQAWPKVEAMFPSRLGMVGRFSNGEAVYRRVAS